MGTQQPISLAERKAECKPLVLVVDDDAIHHKLLNLLAERLEITVHMASSCAQAVEALHMFSFDLILLDYRMPEVDGYLCVQRIRQMKELKHDIPIIAVSAHIRPDSIDKCIEAGMDDLLCKPFTLEELHAKLCYWLQKKSE
ncbi:MAG: response regulator [Candidatus Obscuribacterales bacterium]|jgi:CheY-like chemotaxis protein